MEGFDPLKDIKRIVEDVPKVHQADITGPAIDRKELFPAGTLPPSSIEKMKQTIAMLENVHNQTMHLVLTDTMNNGIIYQDPMKQLKYAQTVALQAVQEILDKAFRDEA